MRAVKHSWLGVAALAVVFCAGTSAAQTGASKPSEELARTRAALAASTDELKKATEELLRLQEAEAARAAATLEQLRKLFADGLIAKSEVEEGERALEAARAAASEVRRQIAEQLADAERLTAEIVAAEELAKAPPAPRAVWAARGTTGIAPRYGATVIRYTGKTSWTLSNIAGIQAFFTSKFGRALPVSAFGQTATHDRFGFDHRHAVDVALHPDSVEGRALINHLQSQGVTFIAFRAAVPGSATGPHIHIGRPSSRI
jgi:hypothetical protein